MVEIVETSELKLERLLRRGVEGESRRNSRRGGMFSLFALGSLSSSAGVEVLTRFFFGVDSGVMSIAEDCSGEREEDVAERESDARVVRLPSTEGTV